MIHFFIRKVLLNRLFPFLLFRIRKNLQVKRELGILSSAFLGQNVRKNLFRLFLCNAFSILYFDAFNIPTVI